MYTSIVSAARKAFSIIATSANQRSIKSIHTVNLVALHDVIHQPKKNNINLKAFQGPNSKLDVSQSKKAKKAAEIERLKEFWSKEPAKVMKAVRERQYAQIYETTAKLAKQNAADPVCILPTDSSPICNNVAMANISAA